MIRAYQFRALVQGLKRWFLSIALLLLLGWVHELPRAFFSATPFVALTVPFCLPNLTSKKIKASTIIDTRISTNTGEARTSNSSKIRVAGPRPSTRWSTQQKPSTVDLQRMDSTTFPTDGLVAICEYLHPKDVTQLACVSKGFHNLMTNTDAIWKALWYRDFGRPLLELRMAREVFASSIAYHSPTTQAVAVAGLSLETSLSKYLDDVFPKSLRELYFVFGETYRNYLLAGRNHQEDAYFGLHGHIFNFTPFLSYHPGLIAPVLEECGQDATEAFEGLPHSKGARAITSLLAVVVDRSLLERSKKSSDSSCGGNDVDGGSGLEIRHPPKNLHQLLRMSNSRPLGILMDPNARARAPEELIPTRPRRLPPRQRPTLERVRRGYSYPSESDAGVQPARSSGTTRGLGLFPTKEPSTRRYFDPLQFQWVSWDVRNPSGA